MKLKRFIATLLSVAMFIGILPITTQAQLVDTNQGKAKVTLHLLLEDSTSANGFKRVDTTQIEKTEGKKFFVGIYAENFQNIQEVKEYTEKKEMFSGGPAATATKGGLNDASFGIVFNPEYLKFEPGAYSTYTYDGDEYSTYNAATAVTNAANRLSKDIGKIFGINQKYTLFSDATIGPADTNIATEDSNRGLTNKVLASIANSNDDYSFPYKGDQDLYFAIFEFEFIKDASALQPGTPLIDFSHLKGDTADNAIKFGKDGAGVPEVKYQDDGSGAVGSSEQVPTQDIREILEFKADPLYPMSYSYKFYTDETCGTAITAGNADGQTPGGAEFTASGISEGTTAIFTGTAGDNQILITEPVAGTDFPLTRVKDEKTQYYDGSFAYVNKAGTEQALSGLGTIDGDDAAKNSDNTDGSEIKIYPVYKDAAEISAQIADPDSVDTANAVNKDPKTLYIKDSDPSYMASAPTTGSTGTVDFTIPTGFAVTKWYTDSSCTQEIVFGDKDTTGVTNLHGVTNIYGKLEKGTTVKFVTDSADPDNNVHHTETILPDATDKTVPAPETDPTKANNNFAGWYTDTAYTTEFVPQGATTGTPTEFNADAYVYAKWNKLVTVEYYGSDGNIISASTETDIEDTVSTLNPPSVADTADKCFTGWQYKGPDGSGTAEDFTVTGKVAVPEDVEAGGTLKLYAKMSEAFSVKFYDKEGTDKTEITAFATSAKSSTPYAKIGEKLPSEQDATAELAKLGLEFKNWYIYVDGTKTNVTSASTEEVSANTEVYAETTAMKKVTFHFDDGGATADKVVYASSSGTGTLAAADVPTVPSDRTTATPKQRCDGWYVADADGQNMTATKVEAGYTVANDVHVWPKWVDYYTVKFLEEAGGTQIGNDLKVDSGEKIADANIPDNKAHDDTNHKYQNGWTTDGTNQFDFANTTITADTTLYRLWANDYTVNFYNDVTSDGTAIDTTTKNGDTKYVYPTVDKKGTVTSKAKLAAGSFPSDPAKTDYTFDAWYQEAAFTNTFDSNTEITSNITAVAKYSQNITFEYDANGGTNAAALVSAGNKVTSSKDTVYTDPANPSRTGYTFKEWNTKSNGTGVKIKADGSKTFAGQADLTKAQPSDATPGNVKVYAIWTAATDPVTLTLNPNTSGVTGVTVNPSTITVSKNDNVRSADLPADPTKQDYTFQGWFEEEAITSAKWFGPNSANETHTMTADDTAYAHWDYDATKADAITVKFWKNDGTSETTPYAQIVVRSGATIGNAMPANPTLDANHTFKEWNDQQNGSGDKYESTTVLTNTTGAAITIELHAQYEDNIKVNFDGNGGAPAPAAHTNKKPSDKLNNVDTSGMTRARYKFKEWNTKTNGSGTTIATDGSKSYKDVLDAYNLANPSNTTAEATLYAIWEPADNEKATEVTLTFNPVLTGITLNPSSVTVPANEYVRAVDKPDDPTKQDYIFKGWFDSQSFAATELDFSGNGHQMGTADETAYAHWDYDGADKVKVNFHADPTNDATITKTIYVKPGEPLGAILTDAEADGYEFDKWVKDSTTGTEFTNTDNVPGTVGGTNNADLDLYAIFKAQITVTFDGNGTTTGVPAAVTKPRSEAYAAPDVTSMKKTGPHGDYTFTGWNTKQNGSGETITAGGGLTYEGLADKYKVNASDDTPTSITLYAQWAAVSGPTDTNPDPNKHGIKITFNDNGTTQKPITKASAPQTKTPELDDTIGTGNMPTDPEREDYTFVKWNTKPDGSGKDVAFDTQLTEAYLGDALVPVSEGSTAYTMTLYAQWNPSPDTEQIITVNFYDNTTAAGGNKTPMTIVEGDSFGLRFPALPTNHPTSSKSIASKWVKGSVTGGKVVYANPESILSAATVINETNILDSGATTLDVFAKWERKLVAMVDEDGDQTYDYTGAVINPIIKIYDADTNGDPTGTAIATSTDADFAQKFNVIYTESGDSNNTPTDVKEVGDYDVNVTVKDGSDLDTAGAYISKIPAATVTVVEAGIDIKIAPTTQVVDFTGSPVAGATIDIDTTQLLGDDTAKTLGDLFDVKYYKWEPADDNDTEINEDEIPEVDLTDLKDEAYYVIKITPKNDSNYKVDQVVSSESGETVKVYPATANDDYPKYVPTPDNDQLKLVFKIELNDPVIESLTAKSTGDDSGETNLDFKESDYKQDKNFAEPDNTTDAATKDNYFAIAPKDAKTVTISFKPKYPNHSTSTVTLNGVEAAVTGPDATTGLCTATVTLPKSTDANYNSLQPIQIKMKAGTAADAPTKTYVVNVQRDLSRIELNPGNSPFGLIARMSTKYLGASGWNDTKIQNAQTNFISGSSTNAYKFKQTQYTPTGANNTVSYSPKAWNNAITADKNMDLNIDAMFIYNGEELVDPGFTAYDAAGNVITTDDVEVERSVDINKMKNRSVGAMKTADLTKESFSIAKGSDTTSGLKNISVCPDTYTMKYKVEDPIKSTATDKKYIETTRPVVVVWLRGDADMSGQLTTGDSGTTRSIVMGKVVLNKMTAQGKREYSEAVESLFLFRMADADLSGQLTTGDSGTISSLMNGKIKQPHFYKLITNK